MNNKKNAGVLIAMGAVFLAIVLTVTTVADASRNSSGTMSAASGPYVPGTTITSTTINSRFADIENEITDSLSRSGKGGMTAALRGSDGTVSAPEFSFTNEVGTGIYRIGANDLGWAIAGTKKLELTGSLFSTAVAQTNTIAAGAAFTGLSGAAGATSPSALVAPWPRARLQYRQGRISLPKEVLLATSCFAPRAARCGWIPTTDPVRRRSQLLQPMGV
jgi:hypothetical protein